MTTDPMDPTGLAATSMVHTTKLIEAYWNGIAIGKRDEREIILRGVETLRARIEADLTWYDDVKPKRGREFDADAFDMMARELRSCLKAVQEMLPELEPEGK